MSTTPLSIPRPAVRARPSSSVQRERHEPEYGILVAIVALAAIGILMVYSSSAIKSFLSKEADTFLIVGPQIVWAALGIVAMVVMMRVDYRWLRVVSVPLFLVALLGLLLVFVPDLRVVVGGSARWLKIGPLPAFHPAEFMKLALVIYLAHWFAKRGSAVHGFWSGTVPFLVIVGPVVALVLLEPDMGTTSVLAFTAFTMFFLAGANLLHLVVLAVAALPIAVVIMRDYQMDRITAWLDPWGDRSGLGFHSVQGFLALALGGLLGAGPRGEPAGGRPVPAQRVERLHLRHHRRGVRVAGRGPRGRPVPRRRLPGHPDVAGRAGHLRRPARGRDHRLDLHPGIHQHRRRGGADPRHGHPAAVRLGRRVVAGRQLRRGGHPALGVEGNGRERNLERCAC